MAPRGLLALTDRVTSMIIEIRDKNAYGGIDGLAVILLAVASEFHHALRAVARGFTVFLPYRLSCRVFHRVRNDRRPSRAGLENQGEAKACCTC